MVHSDGSLGGPARPDCDRRRPTINPSRDEDRSAGGNRRRRRPGHRPCPLAAAGARIRSQCASSDPATAAAARDSFLLAHRILGTVVGETLGYLLTAAWTLLVLIALDRTIAPRWFTALGAVSAVLILAGVLDPLQLPVVGLANFIGYVMWSVWLVIFAILILRHSRSRAATTEPALSGTTRPVTS